MPWVQTNYCCEATARMAADLGYDTLFVLDATYTFDLSAHGGGVISAEDLARVTASNLQDEFADVVMTADLVQPAGQSPLPLYLSVSHRRFGPRLPAVKHRPGGR